MRALAALLPLALSACMAERTRTVSVVEPREEALVVDENGPWREVVASEPEPTASEPLAAAPAPAPPARRNVAAVAPPRREPAFVPERRAVAAPAAGPTLPRDRYLDHPTKIRAQKITLRLPASRQGEVSRSAEAVTPEGDGRVVLAGRARVTCRQLTLEADRIVLETQKAGVEDVAIVARGDVSFVTDQHGQVVREEHARSLLVANDRVTPLR